VTCTRTAIVLTRDEEVKITACLESLEGIAAEIVIVDSGRYGV
jgi:hypothetical protein